jgi:Ni2+-binding GTPase involved in maturation of urease and hydrogenase
MRLLMVGGFLGAGKTSLVSALAGHLLERRWRILILENEAGRAAVDDAFLSRAGLEVQSMLGGCACCDLRPRLVERLEQVHAQDRWDLVVMEPSGVANLAELAVLLAESTPASAVQTVLVADATRLATLRRALPGLLEAQLRAAQAAVLSKVDIAGPKELEAAEGVLAEMAPELPLWPADLTGGQAGDAAARLWSWLEGAGSGSGLQAEPAGQEPAPHSARAFALELPEAGAEPGQALELVRSLAGELLSPERPGHVKLLAGDRDGGRVLASATGARDAGLRGGGGAALVGRAQLSLIFHLAPAADPAESVARLAGRAVPGARVEPLPEEPKGSSHEPFPLS